MSRRTLDTVPAPPQSGVMTATLNKPHTLARLLAARPARRDGHSQRHAGLLLRWRPVPRSCRRHRITPGAWRRKARTFSTSARSRPGPMAECKPVSARGRACASCAGAARGGAARPAGLDRHHQGEGRRLGARARRHDPERRVGPAARSPTWRASLPSTASRLIVMHNRDDADPALDIMADVKEFFARSLEIAARAGIARDQIVLDPGRRLRQDAGAKHHDDRAARASCARSACRC